MASNWSKYIMYVKERKCFIYKETQYDSFEIPQAKITCLSLSQRLIKDEMSALVWVQSRAREILSLFLAVQIVIFYIIA